MGGSWRGQWARVLAWQWNSGGRLGRVERGLSDTYIDLGIEGGQGWSEPAWHEKTTLRQTITGVTPREENAKGIVREVEAIAKLGWAFGNYGGEAGLSLAFKGLGKVALGIQGFCFVIDIAIRHLRRQVMLREKREKVYGISVSQ